jgi:hypothetical protein
MNQYIPGSSEESNPDPKAEAWASKNHGLVMIEL